MMKSVSLGEKRDGVADVGGSSCLTFAKDGETSYSHHHPTSVFASSVPKARPLQTCWRTHPPFRLLSTTIMRIPT
jgi:hypothetical protein